MMFSGLENAKPTYWHAYTKGKYVINNTIGQPSTASWILAILSIEMQ